jgi:hypothetical protein
LGGAWFVGGFFVIFFLAKANIFLGSEMLTTVPSELKTITNFKTYTQ